MVVSDQDLDDSLRRELKRRLDQTHEDLLETSVVAQQHLGGALEVLDSHVLERLVAGVCDVFWTHKVEREFVVVDFALTLENLVNKLYVGHRVKLLNLRVKPVCLQHSKVIHITDHVESLVDLRLHNVDKELHLRVLKAEQNLRKEHD